MSWDFLDIGTIAGIAILLFGAMEVLLSRSAKDFLDASISKMAVGIGELRLRDFLRGDLLQLGFMPAMLFMVGILGEVKSLDALWPGWLDRSIASSIRFFNKNHLFDNAILLSPQALQKPRQLFALGFCALVLWMSVTQLERWREGIKTFALFAFWWLIFRINSISFPVLDAWDWFAIAVFGPIILAIPLFGVLVISQTLWLSAALLLRYLSRRTLEYHKGPFFAVVAIVTLILAVTSRLTH
jgi:hypothetical protein